MLTENYENLKAAIVGQACEDYCYAIRDKKKFKPFKDNKGLEARKYRKAISVIKDCDEFFKNDIGFYMDNPPEYKELIKRLKYVANRPDKYKVVRFLKNTTGAEE